MHDSSAYDADTMFACLLRTMYCWVSIRNAVESNTVLFCVSVFLYVCVSLLCVCFSLYLSLCVCVCVYVYVCQCVYVRLPSSVSSELASTEYLAFGTLQCQIRETFKAYLEQR